MKMTKLWAVCLMLTAMLIGVTACSEDDISSTVPQFADIETEPTTIYVGDSITFTAVQSTYGKYLYLAEYTWSTNMPDAVCVYDSRVDYNNNEHANPTMKVLATAAGRSFTVTLKAKYHVGAQPSAAPAASYGSEGFQATYETSALEYHAKVQKNFRVLSK